MRRLLPMLTLVLGACGYTDAGSGSHSLLVEAQSRFRVGAQDNEARVTVDLAKGTDAVTTAIVAVKDGDTGDQYTLAYDSPHGSMYRYSGTMVGYHRRLELAVVSGNDQLDAKLEGPGPHTVTKPVPGAIIHSGDTLGVEWATLDGVAADEVDLEIGGTDISRQLTEDTGSSHDIPLALLQVDTYDLNVTRLNRVAPAGGLAGSSFVISYGVQTTFNIQ